MAVPPVGRVAEFSHRPGGTVLLEFALWWRRNWHNSVYDVRAVPLGFLFIALSVCRPAMAPQTDIPPVSDYDWQCSILTMDRLQMCWV
jgi:hypothetical protein